MFHASRGVCTLLHACHVVCTVGPEPTTDRFMAVMWGRDERTTPGQRMHVLGSHGGADADARCSSLVCRA